MKTLSYTTLTKTTEAAIRGHLDAAARECEAGNTRRESYERGAANGAFDLWQTLSLHRLDAITRASYAADLARLFGLVSPESPPT